MQKFKSVLMSLGVGMMLLPFFMNSAPAQAYQTEYDYQIYQRSDDPILAPGESVILWVKILNTGSKRWISDDYNDIGYYDMCGDDSYCQNQWTGSPIRLGTIRPIDRNSGFYTGNNWISTNRVHGADEGYIDPGQTASFGFWASVRSDMPAGKYTECFAPVLENKGWMADKNICWNIQVKGSPMRYSAREEEDHATIKLAPGEIGEITFTATNTSNITWEAGSEWPIHLGVIGDKRSVFYDDYFWMENAWWPAENRPAYLEEYQVGPGQTGTFRFKIKMPTDAYEGQKFKENYWLVAEGKQWFDLASGSDGRFTIEATSTGGGTVDTQEVKVMSISYFPLTNNNQVDTSIMLDWNDKNLSHLQDSVNEKNDNIVRYLNNGSKYGQYCNGWKYCNYNVKAALDYNIVHNFEIDERLPESDKYTVTDQASGKEYAAVDYFEILDDQIDVCDYVDNEGVKEIWLWMYAASAKHPSFWESNMSMGKDIKQYWNYSKHGDISNSPQENDLPICENTYTVYGYNYGRSEAMAIENHTHQIEAVMNYADNSMWTKFTGKKGDDSDFYRCGTTHQPPNVISYIYGHDYDWTNERTVDSDCDDWRPDGSGDKMPVNCFNWTCNDDDMVHCNDYDLDRCVEDEGLSYKVWWMKHIPGLNNVLEYKGKQLRNWWELIGDFDNAIENRSLYKE